MECFGKMNNLISSISRLNYHNGIYIYICPTASNCDLGHIRREI